MQCEGGVVPHIIQHRGGAVQYEGHPIQRENVHCGQDAVEYNLIARLCLLSQVDMKESIYKNRGVLTGILGQLIFLNQHHSSKYQLNNSINTFQYPE